MKKDKVYLGKVKVESAVHAQKVAAIFDRIAPYYDFMNDAMSFFIQRYWKHRLVDKLGKSLNLLDLCGGTGSIGLKYYAQDKKAKVTIADSSQEMLRIGKGKRFANFVEWVKTDAAKMPFKNNEFDCCTISFGFRNITDKDAALKEICRVLKAGGIFYCLEFANPKEVFCPNLYKLYLNFALPLMGRIFVQDKASYKYLKDSITSFNLAKENCLMFKRAGFKNIEYEKLSFGICNIYKAEKTNDVDNRRQ